MDNNIHVNYSLEKLHAKHERQIDEAMTPPFTSEKRETLLFFLNNARNRKDQLLMEVFQKNQRIAKLEVKKQ